MKTNDNLENKAICNICGTDKSVELYNDVMTCNMCKVQEILKNNQISFFDYLKNN